MINVGVVYKNLKEQMSKKAGNDYLDIGYDNEIKKDVLIYESDKELMIGSNILMVTLGGGN